MSTPLAAPVLFAFAVSLILAPAVLFLVRRLRVLDVPSARSSHVVATPRGGGIACAVGATLGVLVAGGMPTGATGLLIAAGLFGLIGLADDLRTTSPFIRLALQVGASLAALPWLLSELAGPAAWRAAFAVGVVVWLVGYVNVFNFMDGINGISACQATVAGLAWCAIGGIEEEPLLRVAGAVVAAGALAFAPFNMPSARMFLGDVGSYFLGGWLAVLMVIALRAGVPVEAAAGPVAVYLVDAGTTLVRRIKRGDRWYEAHREHVYQRLTGMGWSHTRTTAVVSIATALCCVLGAASLQDAMALRVGADAVAVGVLSLYVLAPSLLERRALVAA